MANTTNFGWETPDDTDLVKDGASAMRTLGNAIDTSLVDLKGGTTGQVLSKASDTDMDFTWVAQDDSNAIQNAIVDAKGDLISATAADTPARLAVGTNGQVLTADSTTATGLKWATAGGFNPFHIINDSGKYVRFSNSGSYSDRNPTEDTTYYMPIFLPGYAFDRISARTGGGFTGTATLRLGIYNADMATGKPTTVYLDAGTMSVTTGSSLQEITISNTPPAGWYFLAFNVQTLSAGNEWTGSASGYAFSSPFNGTTLTQTYSSGCYYENGVTGAFATAGTLNYSSDSLAIGLRIA